MIGVVTAGCEGEQGDEAAAKEAAAERERAQQEAREAREAELEEEHGTHHLETATELERHFEGAAQLRGEHAAEKAALLDHHELQLSGGASLGAHEEAREELERRHKEALQASGRGTEGGSGGARTRAGGGG